MLPAASCNRGESSIDLLSSNFSFHQTSTVAKSKKAPINLPQSRFNSLVRRWQTTSCWCRRQICLPDKSVIPRLFWRIQIDLRKPTKWIAVLWFQSDSCRCISVWTRWQSFLVGVFGLFQEVWTATKTQEILILQTRGGLNPQHHRRQQPVRWSSEHRQDDCLKGNTFIDAWVVPTASASNPEWQKFIRKPAKEQTCRLMNLHCVQVDFRKSEQ